MVMDDEEYTPMGDDNGDSDESGDEASESFTDENWVVDDLNYELAISDVIDTYSVEQTIFSDAELDDIKTKEKVLIERGDRIYYRD